MIYRVIIEKESDGRYTALCPGLPGCYSWGYTKDEVHRNIREAIEGYLEVMEELVKEKIQNRKAILEEVVV